MRRVGLSAGKRRLLPAIVLGLALPAALAGQVHSPETSRGPVPSRAISPLRLLFFQLTPESPATLGRSKGLLSFDVSESNVLQIRDLPASEFDAEINMEITRVQLRWRYGVSDRTDLGIELPVYRFHSGFLDSYIRSIEDFLGDLKVQRVFEQEVPGGGLFHYRLKRDGSVFFERPGPRSGFGDLALTVKHEIEQQAGRRPALSVRAAIKLATGDHALAMGSGDVDVALGLAAAYDWRRWHFHGTLGATLPFADPFEAAGLGSLPIVSGHLGFTRDISPTWAFHFQLGGTSEPFERLDSNGPGLLPAEPFEKFGGSIIDGTVGFSHTLGRRTGLWLAITEDFHNTNNAASDVTLLASLDLQTR